MNRIMRYYPLSERERTGESGGWFVADLLNTFAGYALQVIEHPNRKINRANRGLSQLSS